MTKLIKCIVLTALFCGAMIVGLYYYLLTDYEEYRFKPGMAITGVFPESRILTGLSETGKTRNKDGAIIVGGPYTLGITVNSKTSITGTATINGFTLFETATGNVLHQEKQIVTDAFRKDTAYGGAFAHFAFLNLDIPYTDCTLHLNLVVNGPWGTRQATIEIPFERKPHIYQAVPILEVLMGV